MLLLGSPKNNQLGNQVKRLLIILSILLLSLPLFGRSVWTTWNHCYPIWSHSNLRAHNSQWSYKSGVRRGLSLFCQHHSRGRIQNDEYMSHLVPFWWIRRTLYL